MADDDRAGLDAVDAGPQPSTPASGIGDGEGDSRVPPHPSVAALRERFGDALLHHEVNAGDEHVVFIDPARNLEMLGWLKDDPNHAYDLLRDVTAVDYGGGRPLHVVYQLWSIRHRRALRVKCELPLTGLEIHSVYPLWKTADWLEREVYDMFGIEFDGHPDLRRILMPENYAEGHPLRKDFPLRGRFSRAEQTRRALSQDPDDYYIPDELEVGRRAQVLPEALDERPDFPDETDWAHDLQEPEEEGGSPRDRAPLQEEPRGVDTSSDASGEEGERE